MRIGVSVASLLHVERTHLLSRSPWTLSLCAAPARRYTRRRVHAVRRLTERLATLPESFEMARATGLTVQQVLYNAQVRVCVWGGGILCALVRRLVAGEPGIHACVLVLGAVAMRITCSWTSAPFPTAPADDPHLEPAAPQRAPQGVRHRQAVWFKTAVADVCASASSPC